MNKLTFQTRLPTSAEAAFMWHVRPRAFDRLQPPFMNVEILDPPHVADGARARFVIKAGPLGAEWIAEHRDVVVGERFTDVQVKGPFKSWEHVHRFVPQAGDTPAMLSDEITYALPAAPVSAIAKGAVEASLRRMFVYRHEVLRQDLAAQARYATDKPLRVGLTGASGLVGTALQAFLTTAGHEVVAFQRVKGPQEGDKAVYDPASGWANEHALNGLDAFVHLAGEPVNGDRWREEKRRRILDSRTSSTAAFVDALKRCENPPPVWVNASAIGIYGNRGDTIVDETSSRGKGFLSDVVDAWEKCLDPLGETDARVVKLRIGIVLSGAGGALGPMLPAFLAGAGGPMGSGKQWMSYIALDDLLDIIMRALVDDDVRGVVNAVAPEAVQQADFARTLGSVLSRPAIIPTPGAALKALLGGDQAQALVLDSTRVSPKVLTSLEHVYRYPDLETALRVTLGKVEAPPGFGDAAN